RIVALREVVTAVAEILVRERRRRRTQVQLARRVKQEEVAYLRHAAHVPAQQVRDGRAVAGGSGRVGIEQRRLLQDEIGGLQRPRRLLRERAGYVVQLALGLGERRAAVTQRIEGGREPHRAAYGEYDQDQAPAQRPGAATGSGRASHRWTSADRDRAPPTGPHA